MAYLLHPDIRGDKLVFTSEDNLWSCDLDGKNPRLILSNLGTITSPRISPDGTKVAFRSTKGTDTVISEIYVISLKTGDLKRVTYFGTSGTNVVDWQSDSTILAVSDEGSPFMRETLTYRIDVNTLAYEQLKLGPTSSMLPTKEGTFLVRGLQDLTYWKRYRGGLRGKVYFDRGNRGSYAKFLQLESGIDSPTFMKNRLYFITDLDGTGNIYSVNLQGKDLKQHTRFKDFFARNLRSDGKTGVFHKGGRIFIFDPVKDKSTELKIALPVTGMFTERRFVEPSSFLEEYSLSYDGGSSGYIVRGKPYVLKGTNGPVTTLADVTHGRSRQLTFAGSTGNMLVVNDEPGSDCVYLVGKEKKTILKDVGIIEVLSSSPSGKLAVASTNRFEMYLLDLQKGKSTLLDRNDIGMVEDISWHPTEKWIAVSYPEGEAEGGPLSSIVIIDIKSGKKTPVTSKAAVDFSPSFDPSGRYLFYLSERALDPIYDKVVFDMGFPKASKPFVVTLDAKEASPIWNRIGSSRAKKETPPLKEISLEGIMNRTLPLPVDAAEFHTITAINDAALLLRFPVEGVMKNMGSGPRSDGELLYFDMTTGKAKQVLNEISGFRVSGGYNKILVRKKDKFSLYEVDSLSKTEGTKSKLHDDDLTRIDLNRIRCEILPRDEWRQMFLETWRTMKEKYWKEEKINQFWDSVRDRYIQFVDQVNSRFELSDVLKEMQGETGTSHSYERGGELYRSSYHRIGKIGSSLEYRKGRYFFGKIFCGDPSNLDERSPLLAPGVDIMEGDELVSINHVKIGDDTPPGKALENLADSLVEVEVKRSGKSGSFFIKTQKSELNTIYRDWVESNRALVRSKFKDAGYIHIPDMMAKGFAEFHRQYIYEWEKPALIVDVRFNGGGHVSHLLLEKLSRKLIGFDIPRRGKYLPYPSYAISGGMVAVTNEFAGSDGDIFSHSFKLIGLGDLIGERTWGGVVGINPRRTLVDGTMFTQPEFSFWFTDVGFGVENYGTDPTIEVDNTPSDYLAGRDTQLEKAVEIAKELAKKAIRKPRK